MIAAGNRSVGKVAGLKHSVQSQKRISYSKSKYLTYDVRSWKSSPSGDWSAMVAVVAGEDFGGFPERWWLSAGDGELCFIGIYASCWEGG